MQCSSPYNFLPVHSCGPGPGPFERGPQTLPEYEKFFENSRPSHRYKTFNFPKNVTGLLPDNSKMAITFDMNIS